MADHISGELAVAALRALPTDKLKSIWSKLHTRLHDSKAHPEPGDYDVMDDIRKVLRDREGPVLQSGRDMVAEAMRDMFQNGVN